MPRFEHYLFGYRRLKGDDGKEGKFASHILRLGISAVVCDDGTFVVTERDYKRFRAYAGGRVRYVASDVCGLPATLIGFRNHIPTIIALILGLILNILLSTLVWDVRVSGNNTVTDGQVISALEEVGFGVGSVWSLTDKEAKEAAVLSSMDEISWVSINRRGTVAYVEIKETEGNTPPPMTNYKCSNIIASVDCIVEEINVIHGRAQVKAGDYVSRGDILISGIIDTEAGTYFTRAEGSIKAQIVETVTSEALTEEVVIEQDASRVCEIGIKLFGLYINIFKNYGNLPKDYAIIENEEVWVIDDRHKVPLSVATKSAQVPIEVLITHTTSELPALASSRLNGAIAEISKGADLVKLKTDGKYIDGGYQMVATLVLSRDIGEEVGVSVTE